MKLQGLMKVCAAMLFCLGNQQLAAQQLKLGTNPSLVKQSALLELESKKQALLLSRIADTNQIVSPVNGMIIYLESDNTFRVRANNYWTKLIADGTAIQSINNSFSPTQEIKAVYTPGGVFGFSTAGGIHTLTIPDASQTAPGFVNYSAQSFKGLKNFTEGLQTYSLRVSNDVSIPIRILGKDASGDVGSLGIDNNLSITGGQLGVKNSTKLWNANKIADYDVLFGTAPANNDVLTFNGTQWIAKAVVMPANSSNYIQNTATAQTASFNITGNGIIGSAGTLALKALTPGSVLFAGTGGVISENKTRFFWNDANSSLGLGTSSPANRLEIAGPQVTTPAFSAFTSGLRLSNIAAATPGTANSKVLSINSTGDVIVTENLAAVNWLMTGNTAAPAGSALGTNDDVKMVIKSNNQSYLEFGRRDLLGLTDIYPDYTDPNQKVTYLRSALQFEAAGASFYKPMFYVDANGNFRMKGSAAGTDLFEFGSTGTANNGGFDFIIGDDGDEPIIFKSYTFNATPATKEMMRLQSGKMGIGVTALPARTLHVNGDMRLTGSAGSPTDLMGRDAVGDIGNVALDAATLKITSGTLAVNNTSNIWNAKQLNGVNINSTAPATDQVLQFDGTEWVAAAAPGGTTFPIKSVGANATAYTLTATDYTLIVNTNNNITITLPAPATSKGRIYNVKRFNTKTITMTTPSGNIDGIGASVALGTETRRCFSFQSDGTNWYIISENY